MALYRSLRQLPFETALRNRSRSDNCLELFSFVCRIRNAGTSETSYRYFQTAVSRMTKSRTYQDAIVALNSLQSNSQTIERSRKDRDVNATKNIPWMEQLLLIVGVKTEDLDSLNVIHVSGTKGKGSTCAFTESLLRSLGYATGFFSSPHLVAVRERIRLAGRPISEEKFARYFWKVYDRLSETCPPDEMPPYFKFLTVMSWFIFLEEKVDVAIVEVGIGGAYDCTNVIRHPVVCGVSSLGFDHMSLLGHTLSEIAWHKAGIFKTDCPAVTVPQPPDAMDVLRKQAEKIGSPLYLAPPLGAYPTETGPLKLGLDGNVQSLNASLALQLCKMWLSHRMKLTEIPNTAHSDTNTAHPDIGSNHSDIGSEDAFELKPFFVKLVLADALETCKWPGRFQHVRRDLVDFYLDGAHTKESVRHCADWFKSATSSASSVSSASSISSISSTRTSRRILLFNSTADRNPEDLLRPLVECQFVSALFCPNIIGQTVSATSDIANFTVNHDQQLARCVVQADVWRDLSKENVKTSLGSTTCFSSSTLCFSSVAEAFQWIESEARETDGAVEVLVTGSLHLVGAMLTLLDPTLQETL